MPLPRPSKGQSRKDWNHVCMSSDAMGKEYPDQAQRFAVCTSLFDRRKAKASMVVHAGDDEFLVIAGEDGPDYVEFDLWSAEAATPPTVKSVPSDPLNDNGSDNPNSAPPAAPFPATVAPTSSQPKGDDGSTPPPGNGNPSDTYPGYVGGEEMARKVEPAKLPNPEGGALDPNPDNATTIPKGGVDSYDDRSAKPGINQLNWLIANKRLQFKVDPRTSLAVWPLSFEQIETDFKRPNKDPKVPEAIDHAKELDPVKDYAANKPYVI